SATLVLAGQEAARERRVGNDADMLLETERLQLSLVLIAEHEVVLRLDRFVADVAPRVALPERPREAPGVIVRGADVADLALADEIVERPQALVEWRLAIVPVRLIEIDEIRLEPGERRLEPGHDVLARQPRVVRSRPHRAHDLRGDQHRVAGSAGAHPRPRTRLRLPRA